MTSAKAVTISTMPLAVNLILYAGDDFWMEITVNDDAGDPYDLSAAEATSQIRAAPSDTVVLADFEITTSANVLSLHLGNSVTQSLPSKGVWDVQINYGVDDTTLTLAYGTVTVSPDVTRIIS